jgi:hypothetical protein
MKKNYILFLLVVATSFTWQTKAQNGGDNCASAVEISEGSVFQTQINDVSGGANGGDSAWFVYNPSENGTINVNSCLGGSDTRVSIWNDCSDAQAIADDDDSCPFATDGTGAEYASEIIGFMVNSDQSYYIQWDDRWDENPFDWELTFDPEGFNDNCQTAQEIVCGGSIEGTTLDKTDTNGVGGPDAFYKFIETSPLPRDVAFSLCTTFDYDSYMRIYTSCDLDNPIENDDACELGSEITLTTIPETTYYIAIEGYNGDTGNFTITVDCAAPPEAPVNDLIENAINIPGAYTDENVNTQFATEEGGNPTNCTIDGFNGVWYYFLCTPGMGLTDASIVSPSGVSSTIFFEASTPTPNVTELIRVEDALNPCFTGTSSSIAPEIGKYYFLLATNSGGATDITIAQNIIGTENIVFENFTYFPNPTSGVVTLKNNTSIEKVILRNILGAVVLKSTINATQTIMDMNNLSSGSYILTVFVNGQSAQYHILKE